MKVHARFEHQLLAVETEHRIHCMLELTAPPAPAERVRPPLHLALVLDRSGSMAGRKLEVMRDDRGFYDASPTTIDLSGAGCHRR